MLGSVEKRKEQLNKDILLLRKFSVNCVLVEVKERIVKKITGHRFPGQ